MKQIMSLIVILVVLFNVSACETNAGKKSISDTQSSTSFPTTQETYVVQNDDISTEPRGSNVLVSSDLPEIPFFMFSYVEFLDENAPTLCDGIFIDKLGNVREFELNGKIRFNGQVGISYENFPDLVYNFIVNNQSDYKIISVIDLKTLNKHYKAFISDTCDFDADFFITTGMDFSSTVFVGVEKKDEVAKFSVMGEYGNKVTRISQNEEIRKIVDELIHLRKDSNYSEIKTPDDVFMPKIVFLNYFSEVSEQSDKSIIFHGKFVDNMANVRTFRFSNNSSKNNSSKIEEILSTLSEIDNFEVVNNIGTEQLEDAYLKLLKIVPNGGDHVTSAYDPVGDPNIAKSHAVLGFRYSEDRYIKQVLISSYSNGIEFKPNTLELEELQNCINNFLLY